MNRDEHAGRSPSMPMLNPLTIKQLQRFRSIKRGYYSAVILAVALVLSLGAELLVNSRALVVHYQGDLIFPTYGDVIPGRSFGLDYDYETNYRELKRLFAERDEGDWVLMPPVPYDALENDLSPGTYPPDPPSFANSHYLGTDSTGRDVLARLVYGFRLAFGFAAILLACNYVIGITLGCAMGFWGGAFDLLFQRLIEILNNVPFLYVIMIVASIVVQSFWTLLAVMVMFGWTQMTWYMRTSTYKEKSREYVLAARAMGASSPRMVASHILPNTISVIVTFIPFSIAGAITTLTALDYLGFGLPPPTPSWGELLQQGTNHLESPWIVTSVVVAMVLVLLMVTYVGEAIREAFDPKKFTYYE
ncbi:MAG: ABC transporter permease subunit [Gammaproteobacteria bacterium]|nr:ABC transporter permease subunit [Gammaproteobacteria bacterium]MDE0224394.1 ABC transporter permease subunit [Gammaproteobacteria bacterium]